MATFRELENKRNEILKNMGVDEIEAVFYDLNKQMLDNIGSSNNGYTSNIDEVDKINTYIRDISKTLKSKYNNIGAVEYRAKLKAVSEKYLDLCRENRKFLFLMYLQRDIFLISRVGTNVSYLKNLLLRLYHRHINRAYVFEKILAEVGVPVAEDVNVNVNDSAILVEDYNVFIKAVVGEIETDLVELNKVATQDLTLMLDGAAEVNLSDELQEVQQMAKKLLDEYDYILANPFEDSVKLHAAVKVEFLKEYNISSSVEAEIAKIDVPAYDFKKFMLKT